MNPDDFIDGYMSPGATASQDVQNYADSYLNTAIPQPTTEIQPVVEPQPAPVPVSNTNSVSTSSRGLDFNTLAKVEAKSPIQKNVNRRMAEYDAQTLPLVEEGKDAINAQRAATQKQYEYDTENARIQSWAATEEKRIGEDFNADIMRAEQNKVDSVNKAVAEWETAKEYAMAQTVNPGKMWRDMTGGEKTGSLASAFVSAFLGTKGINTGIMDTLNKAIDRNIDAQIQNMNQANAAVGMAADGISIARETSSNEIEMRMKAKALALESFRHEVVSTLANNSSTLAQAKALEADAAIRKEINNFNTAWQKERTATSLSIYQQEIQDAHLKRQDSIASGQLALRRQELLAEERRRGAAAVEKEAGDLIFDITRNGTKVWKFKPGLKDEEKAKLREQHVGASHTLNLLTEAIELSKEVGGTYRGPGYKYARGSKEARYDALITEIVSDKTRLTSGLAATDTEYARLADQIKPGGWVSPDHFSELAAQMGQVVKGKADANVRMYLRDVDPEEEKAWRNSPYAPAKTPDDVIGVNRVDGQSPGFGAGPAAILNENVDASVNPVVENPVDKYLGKAQEAFKAKETVKAKPSDQDYKDYTEYKKFFDRIDVSTDVNGKQFKSLDIPESFTYMKELYNTVKGGGENAERARLALEQASEFYDPGVYSSALQAMGKSPEQNELARQAAYYLQRLDSDSYGMSYADKFLQDYGTTPYDKVRGSMTNKGLVDEDTMNQGRNF